MLCVTAEVGRSGEGYGVHHGVVKRVNIHGNRNLPMPELRQLLKKAVPQARIGAAKGVFVVPASFFEPLPDEILRAFRGK
jgi:hypothetical protein